MDKKVAVITGAGAGIGRETALKFARNGVDGLVLADMNEKAVQDLAEVLRNLGVEAIPVKTDVSKAEDCKRMIALGEEKFGRVNVIFNNAGIMHLEVSHCVCFNSSDRNCSVRNVFTTVNVSNVVKNLLYYLSPFSPTYYISLPG